jgi:hypothetical protein
LFRHDADVVLRARLPPRFKGQNKTIPRVQARGVVGDLNGADVRAVPAAHVVQTHAVLVVRILRLSTKSVSLVYRDVWTTVTSFGKTVCVGFGKYDTYSCVYVSEPARLAPRPHDHAPAEQRTEMLRFLALHHPDLRRDAARPGIANLPREQPACGFLVRAAFPALPEVNHVPLAL